MARFFTPAWLRRTGSKVQKGLKRAEDDRLLEPAPQECPGKLLARLPPIALFGSG